MSLSDSPAAAEAPLTSVAKISLALALAIALVGGWFAIRWLVGSTIAETLSTSESPDVDLARMAVRWAPSDPFVHWRFGELAQRNFSATGVQEMVREYQTAVELSPNDFRFWDELGRALEASGDRAGAQIALKRATDLAPNYYYPRWHYGNALLRSGNFQEAFPQLFRAAEANEQLWPQVLNLAWQAYDGDVDRIAGEACQEPRVRTIFASYLVGVSRSDDALRLWQTMSPEERRQAIAGGRALRKAFLDAKQFRAALEVHRDTEPSADGLPEAETFWNGGFEELITLPVTRPFGWTLGSNVQAQISISNEARSGRNSMQVVVTAANRLERINASQTIAVAPNSQYRFECYARTERLSSASTPVVAILDAADNSLLANTTPLPTGTNNWQKISVDFKTKGSDGIIVLITRLPCTVGDICPIFGTIWYDDFNIQRVGSGGARRAAGGTSREGNRAAANPA